MSHFRKLITFGYLKNQGLITSFRLSQNPKRALHDSGLQTFKIGGYPINYIKIGKGSHVVFCLPGILGNLKIHTVSQVQSFDRDKFTFVTWDQPGYGQSCPPERILHDNSMSEDTDIMIELMKKLGFEKYSIMGWSGGGCSALLAAIRYPEIVRKLVIWGTFAYVDENDAANYRHFQKKENRKGRMMQILVDEYGDEFYDQHFGGWMNIFSKIYTSYGGEFISKQVHQIECPTMILHGSEDGLVSPTHGEYLEKSITNSRLIKWKGGKHNLHLRYPDEFNRIVQNFLLEKE